MRGGSGSNHHHLSKDHRHRAAYATDCGVEKIVAVSPAPQKSLVTMPDMLTAMLEKVVIAQGRYLGPDFPSAIICTQWDGDLSPLADFVFANAENADLFMRSSSSIERIPCENFEMKRD